MARLEKRFIRTMGNAAERYHFRDDVSTMAFEVAATMLGKTQIRTDHDDPKVIKAMVERAQAEGWNTIHVKGSEDFRREAWLAGSIVGMEVKGYKPKDRDDALLAELRHERADFMDKELRRSEGRRSEPALRPERGSPASDGRVVDETKVTKPQETALVALEQTMPIRLTQVD